MRFLACLLLLSCAATPRAAMRRMESWRVKTCIDGNLVFKPQCLEESRRRCLAAGMEDSCGYEEPEFQ